MRGGAMDLVTKPFNMDTLGIGIEHALAQNALILHNRDYQARIFQMKLNVLKDTTL